MIRPTVTWKYAASLDGRVAAFDGSSRWISSREAREDAHRFRAECDAVMVGSGTQRADDPHLTVRHVATSRQPIRIVVDSHAATPPDARVLDDAAPTIIATSPDADVSAVEGMAEIVRVPHGDRAPRQKGLDLHALLDVLARKGITSIVLEGGPTLAGSFLSQGLIDHVVAYVSPMFLGPSGVPLLEGVNSTLAHAPRLTIREATQLGSDVKIVAVPARSEK